MSENKNRSESEPRDRSEKITQNSNFRRSKSNPNSVPKDNNNSNSNSKDKNNNLFEIVIPKDVNIKIKKIIEEFDKDEKNKQNKEQKNEYIRKQIIVDEKESVKLKTHWEYYEKTKNYKNQNSDASTTSQLIDDTYKTIASENSVIGKITNLTYEDKIELNEIFDRNNSNNYSDNNNYPDKNNLISILSNINNTIEKIKSIVQIEDDYNKQPDSIRHGNKFKKLLNEINPFKNDMKKTIDNLNKIDEQNKLNNKIVDGNKKVNDDVKSIFTFVSDITTKSNWTDHEINEIIKKENDALTSIKNFNKYIKILIDSNGQKNTEEYNKFLGNLIAEQKKRLEEIKISMELLKHINDINNSNIPELSVNIEKLTNSISKIFKEIENYTPDAADTASSRSPPSRSPSRSRSPSPSRDNGAAADPDPGATADPDPGAPAPAPSPAPAPAPDNEKFKKLIQTAISLIKKKKDDNFKNLIQTAISLINKRNVTFKNLIQTAITLIKKNNNIKTTNNNNNSKIKKEVIYEDNLNDKIVKYCREQLQVFIENDNKRLNINNYTVISTSTIDEDILFIYENPENPSSNENVLSKMNFDCEFKETIPPPETIDPKQPTREKGEKKTQMYIAKFEKGKIVKFLPEDSTPINN